MLKFHIISILNTIFILNFIKENYDIIQIKIINQPQLKYVMFIEGGNLNFGEGKMGWG